MSETRHFKSKVQENEIATAQLTANFKFMLQVAIAILPILSGVVGYTVIQQMDHNGRLYTLEAKQDGLHHRLDKIDGKLDWIQRELMKR